MNSLLLGDIAVCVTNEKRFVADDDITFWILVALGHKAKAESAGRHYLHQLCGMVPGKT